MLVYGKLEKYFGMHSVSYLSHDGHSDGIIQTKTMIFKLLSFHNDIKQFCSLRTPKVRRDIPG